MMTRPSRTILAGLLAVALAVGASGCNLSFETLPQLGGQTGPSYSLHAVFSNVQNLASQAQVRDGDSIVGNVTAISTHNYQAELTMKIHKGVTLPVGTTAEVRFNTPLGDEFVELTQPTTRTPGPALQPGSTIGPPNTQAAPSVEDLLAAVAAVLYGGGLGQARTVVTEFNQIIGNGNQPQIHQLLADLDTTLTSFSSNDSNLDNALAAVAQVSGQLNAGSATLTHALDTLPAAAQALSADNGQLQQLLTGLNNLSPVAISVVAQSGQNLLTDARELVPLVNQLVAVQSRVGTDLNAATDFLQHGQAIAPNGYLQVGVNYLAVFPNGAPNCTPPVLPPPAQAPNQCPTQLSGGSGSSGGTPSPPSLSSPVGLVPIGAASAPGVPSLTQLLSGGLP